MIPITLEKFSQVVNGEILFGDADIKIENVSIDSRDISENCLFVPIRGERFDGHDYIIAAQEKGAVATLTEKEQNDKIRIGTIRVKNTLKAFQEVARWVRETVNIPVVAVTGSSGKTSTKEMIHTVLSDAKNTLKNTGNLNNDIGLPKSLLRLENGHECAVVELGMNHAGEIHCITRIAQPNIGVITNIGVSHIENLGSRENIFKAKMEIIDGMKSDGILIVNGDDEYLPTAVNEFKGKTLLYGLDNSKSNIRAMNVENHGIKGLTYTLYINNQPVKEVHVTQPGQYNVYNSLAAIAVGMSMNLSIDAIIESIKKYKPEKMRFNIIEQEEKQILVINDAYNANPDSTKASLKAVSELREGRIIAVLGDMLELGEHAKSGHEDIGKYVAELGFDQLLTIGDLSQNTCNAAAIAGMDKKNIYHFDYREALHARLTTMIRPNDMILVKGSRGMKMEKTVEYLTEKEEGDKK